MVSWISLAVPFASAGLILVDIFGRRCRQQMGIIEAAWPVTALYSGPLLITSGIEEAM